jgi:predicted RNase H-like HicB family nuclease
LHQLLHIYKMQLSTVVGRAQQGTTLEEIEQEVAEARARSLEGLRKKEEKKAEEERKLQAARAEKRDDDWLHPGGLGMPNFIIYWGLF